jgi:voltage-dependent anion channel protein 2
MSYTPPTFGNLGKAYSDLFKKKYDFDNALKLTSKTDFGLTPSVSAKIYKDKIGGSLKAVYVDKSFGEAEGEIDAASGKAWGKVTLTKILQPAKFIFNGGFDPTSKDPLVKDGYSLKTEAEYRKDYLAGSASVLLGDDGKSVAAVAEVAGVVGMDGVAVGGQVKVSQQGSLLDYNVGAQYEKSSFVATVKTEHQGDVIRLSFYHAVRSDLKWGAEILSDEYDRLSKPAEARRRVISVAEEFQVDGDTLLKARLNNFGEIGTVVEHRLHNPNVVVGAAAQFKADGSARVTPDKFGLTLSIGE